MEAINTFDCDRGFAFSTYAIPIIRNKILNIFRRKSIVPTFSIDEPRYPGGEDSSDSSDIADSKCFEEDSLTAIQFTEFLPHLSELERKIVSLRLNNKTQREIAKFCEISQTYVSATLRSVRVKYHRFVKRK